MIEAKRLNEFDVVARATPDSAGVLKAIVRALREDGFEAWKVGRGAYQISFSGRGERQELPEIGESWSVWEPSL